MKIGLTEARIQVRLHFVWPSGLLLFLLPGVLCFSPARRAGARDLWNYCLVEMRSSIGGLCNSLSGTHADAQRHIHTRIHTDIHGHTCAEIYNDEHRHRQIHTHATIDAYTQIHTRTQTCAHRPINKYTLL